MHFFLYILPMRTYLHTKNVFVDIAQCTCTSAPSIDSYIIYYYYCVYQLRFRFTYSQLAGPD